MSVGEPWDLNLAHGYKEGGTSNVFTAQQRFWSCFLLILWNLETVETGSQTLRVSWTLSRRTQEQLKHKSHSWAALKHSSKQDSTVQAHIKPLLSLTRSREHWTYLTLQQSTELVSWLMRLSLGAIRPSSTELLAEDSTPTYFDRHTHEQSFLVKAV